MESSHFLTQLGGLVKCPCLVLMHIHGIPLQVDACELAPSHNIILHLVFFAIGIVQIEEYNITKELYIWPYV